MNIYNKAKNEKLSFLSFFVKLRLRLSPSSAEINARIFKVESWILIFIISISD